MKYGIVTTFPNAAWDVYAKQMLASFRQNWDLPILVVLDDETLIPELKTVLGHPEDVAAVIGNPDYKAFFERNAGKDDPKDYRKQYTRFAHKVFAMEYAAGFYGEKIDYLVWIDADVITKAHVKEEYFKKWVPKKSQIASYLGRKDWSASETGVLIFKAGDATNEFLRNWKKMYVTDQVLFFPEWTDAYAFDVLRKEFNDANKKELFRNLTDGVPGRDVFEHSPLATHMEHFKGNRKQQLPVYTKQTTQHSNAMHGGQFDVKNMNIQTKNCVQDDTIQKNVMANLRLMDRWVDELKENDEEIVICSAGPSLSVDEIYLIISVA